MLTAILFPMTLVLVAKQSYGYHHKKTPTNLKLQHCKRGHGKENIPLNVIHEAYESSKNEIKLEDLKCPEKSHLTKLFGHYGGCNERLSNGRRQFKVLGSMIKKYADKMKISVKEAGELLEDFPFPPLAEQEWHTPRPLIHCDPHKKFRTVDGECNNLHHKIWGASNAPFTRIACPDYANGISEPRVSHHGGALPNTRWISKEVFGNTDISAENATHMAMLWGQFVDHDIALAALPGGVDCKGKCTHFDHHGHDVDESCFGIPIGTDDPPFNKKGVTCIELLRDVPFGNTDGKIHCKREQVNQRTAFLDASMVYGDNVTTFEYLRDPDDKSQLRMMGHPKGGKNLLPEEGENGFCRTPDPHKCPCFMAGDERVNENPGLASMHTMFAREHNRIAGKLKRLNPHWDDDTVFLESRRIVGAMVQHITYNEFLQVVLDPGTIKNYHLSLERENFYDFYDPHLNPGIVNAFAAAAYRFGHSLIRETMKTFDKKCVQTGEIPINTTFVPKPLYDIQGPDKIMRGFSNEKALKVDPNFAKSIMNALVRFKDDCADLPALNMQRGRDHGLPGYNTFRVVCGLPYAKRFRDFRRRGNHPHVHGFVMTPANIRKLYQTYDHPDDVDLFVGMLMESALPGGMVGPTVACIIGEQFFRLRHGDRMWYETGKQAGSFTIEQLREIRQASLARVICDNSDHIKKIQPRAMEHPTWQNQPLGCDGLPKVSLGPWKE